MQQASRLQGMIKFRTINLACSFSFNRIIQFQIQVFDFKQSRLGHMKTLILTGGFNLNIMQSDSLIQSIYFKVELSNNQFRSNYQARIQFLFQSIRVSISISIQA